MASPESFNNPPVSPSSNELPAVPGQLEKGQGQEKKGYDIPASVPVAPAGPTGSTVETDSVRDARINNIKNLLDSIVSRQTTDSGAKLPPQAPKAPDVPFRSMPSQPTVSFPSSRPSPFGPETRRPSSLPGHDLISEAEADANRVRNEREQADLFGPYDPNQHYDQYHPYGPRQLAERRRAERLAGEQNTLNSTLPGDIAGKVNPNEGYVKGQPGPANREALIGGKKVNNERLPTIQDFPEDLNEYPDPYEKDGLVNDGLRLMSKGAVKGAEAIGGFAKFQAERILSYGSLVKTQFLENRRGVKFEKQKAKYNVADGEVNAIQNEINKIKAIQDSGEASPKDAVRLEKKRRSFQKDLIKAEEQRDNELRKTRFQEGMVMVHENKKQLIAEQFAHFVNERLSPRQEKFDNLSARKDMLQAEISTWRDRLESQTVELNEIKELAKDNPYLKDTFKQRIKEAERKISESRSQLIQRSKDVLKTDGKLLKVNNVLQKWNVKKDAYARFAEDRIEAFVPDALKVNGNKSLSGYKNPLQGPENSAEHNATPDTAPNDADPARPTADTNTPDTSTPSSDTESDPTFEAPKRFDFDQWTSTWNKMYGSKLPVSMEAMFDPDIVVHHRRNKTEVNQNQFAAFLHNYHEASLQGTKTKLSAKEISSMASTVFDQLQRDIRKVAGRTDAA